MNYRLHRNHNFTSTLARRGHQYNAIIAGLVALAGGVGLAGCGGGQDIGGLSRGLGGDIGSGYNTSLGANGRGANGEQTGAVGRGAYPMIATAFRLGSLPGDPFDFEKVNVQVTLNKPDGGKVEVPAFFDGDATWRMRYTPSAPGRYSVVTVKLNGETVHEEKLEPKEWTVGGDPQPGFVRVDRGDHSRFVFDNGARYFPIGHNVAWQNGGQADIPTLFGKMHQAQENWSRVWMTHWDGKNLDWPANGKPAKLGEIDLAAARKWDAIVEAAGKNDIYFQMTLQHHGQVTSKSGYRYSANTDPNWEANPYNAKNGGFLAAPEDFFTNPQARALTRRKLYYTLARWGYSPNILAFELFNEVENTDAAKGKLWDDIALWHREMALFLRQFDGYRHLITTSAAPGIPLTSPIWETVDVIESHAYPADVLTALSGAALKPKSSDKPALLGEFGPQNLTDTEGVALHEGLWASLMHNPTGAALYWDWDIVEKRDLYSHFAAASAFVTASGLANQGGLVSVAPTVETAQRSDLRFGAGGGFTAATQNEFVVGANGVPAGMERFPAFLQGQNHRDMMPKPLTFQVNYPQAGTFTLTIGQVAKAGAHLKVSVDGKATERDFASGPADFTPKDEASALQIAVPSGAHTITIENAGTDWVVARQFAFSNYAPALAAQARVGRDYAVAWIYHRANVDKPAGKESSPASGRLSLAGLKPGRYRATWWDTRAGKSLEASEVSLTGAKDSLTLTTPSVSRDVALYVVKADAAPAKSAGKKPRKSPATTAGTSGVGANAARPFPSSAISAPGATVGVTPGAH